MKAEITREVFMQVARGALLDVIAALYQAQKNGREISLADLEVPSVFSLLWEVVQPDTQCDMFELSGRVDHLPDAEKYGQDLRYWVFRDGDGDLMMSFVEGSKTGTNNKEDIEFLFRASDAFEEGLLTETFKILTEELGFSAEEAHTALASDLRGRMRKLLDDTFEKRVDAEVAAFREEINTKLDTLFGKGGDGP